ncbi:hypothetical protein HK102_008739, partial [Quaeritorhiza haematococci]
KRLLYQALNNISKDAYLRRRVYGMLIHMALWHNINKEPSVAAFLLCEASILTPTGTEKEQISRFNKSVVVQLMVNKHFNVFVGMHAIQDFGDLGNYGRGLTNHSLYSKDLLSRKDLPGLALTTSVAALPAKSFTSFTNVPGT